MISAFINWWMPIAAVLVMAIVLVIYERRRRARQRTGSASLPVAHSDRLTALPSYRRALRRYRVLLSASVALVLVALARSEERRVGKECDRVCRSRWSPYH